MKRDNRLLTGSNRVPEETEETPLTLFAAAATTPAAVLRTALRPIGDVILVVVAARRHYSCIHGRRPRVTRDMRAETDKETARGNRHICGKIAVLMFLCERT